jgi:hypothetical protein
MRSRGARTVWHAGALTLRPSARSCARTAMSPEDELELFRTLLSHER